MKDAVENGPDPARLKGASLPRTATRLFLATRPMFFPASVLPVLLGTALGVREGGDLDVGVAALALGATVLVHAGANTVNDVYDDLSGTDVANLARIYPFTGGSRFIQNSILSRGAMLRWGLALLLVAAAGLALAALKGAVVIGLGVAGGLLVSRPATTLHPGPWRGCGGGGVRRAASDGGCLVAKRALLSRCVADLSPARLVGVQHPADQ